MAIQFHCPQGHLLQGEEAHMGMQTQCPFCGVMFLIPVIDLQAYQSASVQPDYGLPHAGIAPQQPYLPAELHGIYDPTASEPGLAEFLSGTPEAQPQTPAPEAGPPINIQTADADEPAQESFLHIPCPNGHELETPHDMLGQEVLCPHCNAQFRLHAENSREHLAELEKLERERARFWFNWSIAAAIIIGGGLLVMLLLAVTG